MAFRKTGSLVSRTIDSISDYLLWYAKNKEQLKFNPVFLSEDTSGTAAQYRYVELPDGQRTRYELGRSVPHGSKSFQPTALHSAEATQAGAFEFELDGLTFAPPLNRHWSTSNEGIARLKAADRIWVAGKTPRYVRYLDDYPVSSLTNVWDDTMGAEDMVYAVQTNTKVVERCILMTTDPGDLVFDSTCGSDTTAYCAEKWGRRWITCDTSRVALAIARQRLMTAKFDYYELREPERGPAGGLIYETVPHITLESIAKNTEIDAIAAEYQPQIDQALADLNDALVGVIQHTEHVGATRRVAPPGPATPQMNSRDCANGRCRERCPIRFGRGKARRHTRSSLP
ncbi:MAG: DNA methyltransferase [bacterium]|nr:site-specific DNA-methyltransferase [candidate division KSB1 bacterium]MDH7558886.1 DNA methyltransferase [bacterium]